MVPTYRGHLSSEIRDNMLLVKWSSRVSNHLTHVQLLGSYKYYNTRDLPGNVLVITFSKQINFSANVISFAMYSYIVTLNFKLSLKRKGGN